MLLLLPLISILCLTSAADLYAGVGIADVTGPIAEINFMGYGQLKQKGTGLHLRQFSRAFIFDDGSTRMVIASVDCGMIGDGVRLKVIEMLQKRLGDVYNEGNVMLSGTHTHSAPGGHLFHLLFDITILGFSKETFNALVFGIVKSIIMAHDDLQPAELSVSKGELLDSNINRSPTAYLNNPEEERNKYKFNVDKDMLMLKIKSASGEPKGAISWFAVHPTSMNNTNTLVSSDNVGYASVLLEQHMNPGSLVGKGKFVGAFASTNLGDVSPNTAGPHCMMTGRECNADRSTCPKVGKTHDDCVASGPGTDMFESTRIIAEQIFEQGKTLWGSKGRQINGPLRVGHQYLDMPTQVVTKADGTTGATKNVGGCLPAMGYSFGAGTTDGPGTDAFSQGTTNSDNLLWNSFRDFLAKPTKEDIACQMPKPILIPTGRMTFPYDWQPRIVSTQLALFEGLALACVPGEFTTMAGRRLRKAITNSSNIQEVVVVGLCNTYSDYITTFEEYQIQRYEGASTIFGPYTLDIYLQQYSKMTTALLKGQGLEETVRPKDLMPKVISLITPVILDTPKWSFSFGEVTRQPPSLAHPGQTVSARFVSGHPRNDPRHGDTYLTVERKENEDLWTVIATDANWETKFHWIRLSKILGSSEVLIEWTIPEDTPPGEYRIRHFGAYKKLLGGIQQYTGTTKTFKVSPGR